MSDPTPTNTAAKYGLIAAGGVAGAVALLALKSASLLFSFIAGAALLFFGIGLVTSKNQSDNVPGMICAGSGALAILSLLPFLRGFAKWLLGAGAFALFVVGVWHGIKFMLALKSRS